jgi:hypothetical protein
MTMKKVIAVVAVFGMLAAGQAFAADKLIVKDAAGTSDVFKVDDSGIMYGSSKLIVGAISNPSSQITVVDQTGSATRGIGAYQATSDTMAGVIDFRKMRGAYTTSPTVANATLNGDFVGAFHAWGVDSAGSWRRGATINYFIDSAPTNGGVPIALLFSTGTNDDGLANPKTPRMRIGSDGKISIGNGNTAAVISGNGIMDIGADTIRLRTARTPAPSSATCNQGEISWDASFIYVCVSTNTWKRASLSSY